MSQNFTGHELFQDQIVIHFSSRICYQLSKINVKLQRHVIFNDAFPEKKFKESFDLQGIYDWHKNLPRRQI